MSNRLQNSFQHGEREYDIDQMKGIEERRNEDTKS